MMRKNIHRRVLGVLVAVALLGAGSLLGGCDRGPAVPDVVGKSQADAVRALQEAGFLLGEVSPVFSNEVPVGYIAATVPPAGTTAREGTAVDVKINVGTAASIVVPDLMGLDQAAAEERLTRIELVPYVAEGYSDTVLKGTVMAQVPQPGSLVVAEAQIAFQISQGPAPEKVEVPDVEGDSTGDAEDAIEKAGLDSVTHEVYSDAVAKGRVIGQSPAAGEKVTKGSEVAIVVSLGKGTGAVTVPNVVGKSEADAKKALESAKLKVKVYQRNSDSVAKGRVIEQVPSAGTRTASGAEVGIAVSLGPATATGNPEVPNVTGETEADARAALEAAGFSVQVVERADGAAAGTVVQQLPVAKSTAPPGSAVYIAVSTGPDAPVE